MYLFGIVDIDILIYKPDQTQKTMTYDNLQALYFGVQDSNKYNRALDKFKVSYRE